VADLPEARRELALAAIRNDGPRVYPETELGERTRYGWFDGVWTHEGATYRGKEVQQATAACFGRQVWGVLSMRPTRLGPRVVFELRAPGDAVCDSLDEAFEPVDQGQ
jgi:hypothetical protein